MLQNLRAGAASPFVKYGLFGALVLSFFGWGLSSGGFSGMTGLSASAVAEVDGQEIPLQVFEKDVRQFTYKQNISTKAAYDMGILDQILQSKISTMLLQKHAGSLGLTISEEKIAQELHNVVAPYVTDEITPQQALEFLLRQQGLTESDLISGIKMQLRSNIVREAFFPATLPTLPQTLGILNAASTETRDVEYLKLTPESIKNLSSPTEEDLGAWYEENREIFRIPEHREILLARLDTKGIESEIVISQEDLQAEYDAIRDTLLIPEIRDIAQAVFETEEEANSFLSDFRGKTPEAFKDAVLKSSAGEDGYREKESWTRQDIPEDMKDAAFIAQKGALAGPIETPFGWHLLYVAEISPETMLTFDDTKNQLEDDLKAVRLDELLIETANRIDDNLAGGTTLQDLARDMQLRISTYGPFDNGGLDENGKSALQDIASDRRNILNKTFELEDRIPSQVFQLKNGDFAVLQVSKILPSTIPEFETVRSEVSKHWVKELIRTRLQDLKENIFKDVQSTGEEPDLKALAARYHGTYKKHNALQKTQGDTEESTLPAKIRARAFSAPLKALVPVWEKDGLYLLHVTGVHLGDDDPETFPENARAALSTELSEKRKNEFTGTLEQTLRSEAKIKINDGLIARRFGDGEGKETP